MTTERHEKRAVPAAYHIIAALFVTSCAWMALWRPEAYAAAMQEDRAIEWMTTLLFAAAGVIALTHAIPRRRWFDVLVGAFLLFVAGEEISWGQRLLGLTPPSYFLAHNTQQEMNVHNFADVFGSPKGPFALVLAGYSLLLPAAARVRRFQPLLARIGATPPPGGAIPWFLAAIVLLLWYPFRFTGEWTELLAGSAFLVSMAAPRTLAILLPAGIAASFALQALSARTARGDATLVACARTEAVALADVARLDLAGLGSAHKRVWTFVDEGRLQGADVKRALAAAACGGAAEASRKQFAVDPWGTAYWIRVTGDSGVTVYSFGPNRRRDPGGGDDITSATR